MLFFLAIAALFFWILTKVIIEIIRIIRKRKERSIKVLISITVLSIGIADGMYNLFKIDLDSVYRKIVFRAGYEGT